MNSDYYGPMAGLGIGMVILGIILYLGILALMLWVFYLIVRTAVKNGILKADEERAARSGRGAPPQGYRPPHGYPGAPGPSAPSGGAHPAP